MHFQFVHFFFRVQPGSSNFDSLTDQKHWFNFQVVLPFWKKDNASSSANIDYTPDETDDWDEEDPDDDLDF